MRAGKQPAAVSIVMIKDEAWQEHLQTSRRGTTKGRASARFRGVGTITRRANNANPAKHGKPCCVWYSTTGLWLGSNVSRRSYSTDNDRTVGTARIV
eukprot:6214713-Pleurochrysis_carterae.AAC.2